MLNKCESHPNEYIWLYRQILKICNNYFDKINAKNYEKTAFMFGSKYMQKIVILLPKLTAENSLIK
jgi:hypothetical protein